MAGKPKDEIAASSTRGAKVKTSSTTKQAAGKPLSAVTPAEE
jgi:hypothetical protein